jgi:deoxyribonuclease IV
MSVAGGLLRAVERAVIHRCEAFQIFTKNANRWFGRPLMSEEIHDFRATLESADLGPVVSHASYLINLATARTGLRDQSIVAMADEIDRAEALGLRGVVLHPGCYTDGSEERGIDLIADALLTLFSTRAHGRCRVLIEQTAGQGTAIGATLDQLAAIIARTDGHPRLGVCLDTCHLLAAGYDLCTPDGYDRTFEEFERLIGFDRLEVIHVNDSKKPLGSRVDRHEHIGLGYLGLAPFRRLVNDARFAHLPMLLETPKALDRPAGRVEVDPLDERNLNTLRGLVSKGEVS